MATTLTFDHEAMETTLDSDYSDTVTERWNVLFDTPQSVTKTVYDAAVSLGMPARNAAYWVAMPDGSVLYAKSHKIKPDGESRRLWYITINYAVPPSSEFDPSITPLDRPVVFNIEYTQSEYNILEARNVEDLEHGNGDGSLRKSGTLGPIANAVGKRPDEPIIATEQNAILVVQKNYSTLAEIAHLNNTYKRTTNSKNVQGFLARTLKYLVTESVGKQSDTAGSYWPGITRIEVMKTTDLTFDNVGYEYWEKFSVPSGPARAKYEAGEDKGKETAEPIKLKLDGSKGGTTDSTITWRYLEPIAYQPLMT